MNMSLVDPVTPDIADMADSSHRLYSLLALGGSLAHHALCIFMFSVDSSCSSKNDLPIIRHLNRTYAATLTEHMHS
jgi:hypothetical protein